MPRFIAATVVLLAAATVLVGCVKEEEPEPQWTEESAYAAAEETFRAFNLAVYDAEKPTLPFVIGEMVDMEKEAERKSSSVGLEIRGDAEVYAFSGSEFRMVGDSAVVEATACVDATGIEVRTTSDDWRQPRDQPTYGVMLAFVSVDGEMLIDDYYDTSELSC